MRITVVCVTKTHFCNDRACSDRATPMDCQTRQYGRIGTNIAAVFDHDWLSISRDPATIALIWIDGRRHGENTHIRPDNAPAPDLCRHAVEDDAVDVDSHVLSFVDVIFEVTCEWWFDNAALADRTL